MPAWLNALAGPGGVALALIKSSLIVTTAAAVTYMLRKTSSAALHLVWTVAMLLTIMSVAGPLLPWQYNLRTPQFVSADSWGQAAPPIPARPAPPAAISGNLPARPLRVRATQQLDWVPLVPAAWLLGTGLLLFRLLIARIQLARISRRGHLAASPLLQRFNSLVGKLGIARPITLLLSEKVDVPLTWGILHARIVLPASATEWKEARIEHVLLHELTHVQRFDTATQTLAEFACALCWYNPLVWLAARRMRIEREIACDHAVIAAGARASDYASDLLSLAVNMRFGNLYRAGVGMAGCPRFERRLRSILDSRSRPQVSRLTFAALLAAAVAVVPLAAVQVQDATVALRHKVWPTTPKGIAFLQLMWEGNVEKAVDEMRRDPSLVNTRGREGQTPLMIALMSRSTRAPEMAKLLIATGADVNAQDSAMGSTPLSLAVRYPDIVALLLDRGADPNVTDIYRRTALDEAAFAAARVPQLRAAADLLLQHGARLNFFDALQLGKTEEVREFLAEDPSLAASSTRRFWPVGGAVNETALQAAVGCMGFDRERYAPIVQLLASYVPHPTFVQAAMLGRIDLLTEHLAKDPALVETTGDDCASRSPLDWAVRYGNLQTATFLLGRGATADAMALTDAITVGDANMVKLLLAHGADPHARGPCRMPLNMYQHAMALGQKDIAALLK